MGTITVTVSQLSVKEVLGGWIGCVSIKDEMRYIYNGDLEWVSPTEAHAMEVFQELRSEVSLDLMSKAASAPDIKRVASLIILKVLLGESTQSEKPKEDSSHSGVFSYGTIR